MQKLWNISYNNYGLSLFIMVSLSTSSLLIMKKINECFEYYLAHYALVLACWYIQYATPIIIRTMMMPTIIGARTFTKKTNIAIIIIAAIIATIIEPALLPDAIIIWILQNINRWYIRIKRIVLIYKRATKEVFSAQFTLIWFYNESTSSSRCSCNGS